MQRTLEEIQASLLEALGSLGLPLHTQRGDRSVTNLPMKDRLMLIQLFREQEAALDSPRGRSKQSYGVSSKGF